MPHGSESDRSGLTETEWQAVNELGRTVKRPAGTTLANQGGTDKTVFAIREGVVDIIVHQPNGSSITVGKRGPGQLVGEMAALDGEPRSASMLAVSEVVVVVLSQDGFYEVLHRNPKMTIDLLMQVSQRLRAQTTRHAERSNSLKQRVAAQLVTFAQRADSDRLSLTQYELASWVDATREATAKELRVLREIGAIETGRGFISILDRDQLIRRAALDYGGP